MLHLVGPTPVILELWTASYSMFSGVTIWPLCYVTYNLKHENIAWGQTFLYVQYLFSTVNIWKPSLFVSVPLWIFPSVLGPLFPTSKLPQCGKSCNASPCTLGLSLRNVCLLWIMKIMIRNNVQFFMQHGIGPCVHIPQLTSNKKDIGLT